MKTPGKGIPAAVGGAGAPGGLPRLRTRQAVPLRRGAQARLPRLACRPRRRRLPAPTGGAPPPPAPPTPAPILFSFLRGAGVGHALAVHGCGRAPRAGQPPTSPTTVRLQPAGCPSTARLTTTQPRAGWRGLLRARAGGLAPCRSCRHAPCRQRSRDALTAFPGGYRDVVPAQSP